ncbi:MAG TPA: PepSY-associated TM helix domain-containing protein [Chroococcales cyanobacterium]
MSGPLKLQPPTSSDSPKAVAGGHHSGRWRPGLTVVHRWVGVFASLYFCWMSITGVSMVFRDELDELLVKRPTVAAYTAMAPLSKIVSTLNDRYPHRKLTGLMYPLQPGKPLETFVQNQGGGQTRIFVDPGTAAVLEPADEHPVLKFLQEAHFNLLLNKTGRKINALCGLALAFLALSGIALFARGVSYCLHTLKMKWKGSARVIAWSHHQKVGFFLFPMLLVWGISAYSFGFHDQFQALVNVVMPVTALRKTSSLQTATGGIDNAGLPSIAVESVNRSQIFDSAQALATSLCPAERISRISLPAGKEHIAKFWLTGTESNNKVDATEVDIDFATGQCLAVIRLQKRTAGDTFLVWLPRVHFGNFAGIYSKCIWCVIGFTPMFLSITGLIMWWHPRHRAGASGT